MVVLIVFGIRMGCFMIVLGRLQGGFCQKHVVVTKPNKIGPNQKS